MRSTCSSLVKLEGFNPSNLEDLAALIASLDAVFASDSSAPLMSAALGVPTVVLVNYEHEHWWKPNFEWKSAVVSQQSKSGNWPPVFESAFAELSKIIGGKK